MNALVLGGADCLWDDLLRLHAMVGPWDGVIIACNRAGVFYPHRIDYWATAHPERIAAWKERRAERGGNMDFKVVSTPDRLALDQVDLLTENWGGSSGLLGVTAAKLVVVAHRVVGCGVPLSVRPHFDHPADWVHATGFQKKWLHHRTQLSGFFRSMSGWTAETFGTPTRGWIMETRDLLPEPVTA